MGGVQDEYTELTCSQDQIWLQQQQFGDSSVFNLTFAFHIEGPIDLVSFKKAFDRLVIEADCLRLRIIEINQRAYQYVDHCMTIPINILDFTQALNPDQELADWIRSQAVRQVNFSQLLLGSYLVLLTPQRALWVLTVHHAVADSWGLFLLYKRLVELYEGFKTGEAVSQLELLPYSTIVDSDKEYRSSDRFLEDQRYWKNKLACLPGPVSLYGKSSISDVQSSRREEFDLNPELSKKLGDLIATPEFSGQTVNIAVFNVLLTAYAVFMYRVSGQESFLIGVPHLNRPGILRFVPGLTTEQAPIEVSIEENETFKTLFQKIRIESAETARHSRYPVANQRNQVYNVIFNYHNRPYQDEQNRTETWCFSGSGSDDLVLNVLNPNLSNNHIRLGFDLSNDLFDQKQGELLIQHFMKTLAALVECPEDNIDLYPLLSEEERQQIFIDFNPSLHTPSETRFIQRFIDRVKMQPDAIAAEAGSCTLTYRELDQCSSRLAQKIADQRVGPGAAVGLYIDRSIEMAVGLLAILKSGNTYVPLDPNYPEDRLTWISRDAGICCVLTRPDLMDQCPSGDYRKLSFEPVGRNQDLENGSFDWPVPDLDAVAYIIYTSGSTGRPKGVVVSHRQMIGYLEVETAYLDLKPGDRFLYFSALGSDASIEEILPAWMSGATLVFCPKGLPALGEFNRLIWEKEINILSLPAAFWAEWVNGLEECGETLADSIRMVMVYAEEPSIPKYLAWKRLAPDHRIRWINTYGPTESVVTATVYEPGQDEDPSTWKRFPIGTPLANHTIYILDRHHQPVPVGTPGEIYIGGNLSSGYRNLPKETALSFVPDPFTLKYGQKMYRTGDWGRFLPDGVIEFLGRIDFQVKLHGFRIELGEIESWLTKYPGIARAVACLKKTGNETDQLVAYLTLHPGASLDPADVRECLKKYLPGYMLPSEYVVLQKLPLTPNGKIDRDALPVPARNIGEKTFRGANLVIEAQLIALWQQVLGVCPIGIEDDFFDLGGDSLLGVRLFDLIRRKLEIWLPVSILMACPTIKQLAEYIQNNSEIKQFSHAIIIRPGTVGTPLFLIHGWGGGVTSYAELVRTLDPRWPIYGIQAAGLLNEQNPDESVEAMANRYIDAIRSIQPKGPYRIGGYCTGGVIAYAIACSLEKQGEQVSLVAIIDGNAPKVDLDAPPLLSRRRTNTIWTSIPYWYRDYRDLGFKGIRQRIIRKAYGFFEGRKKKVTLEDYSASDVILDDPTPLPDYQMRILVVELKAIADYQPEKYSGDVVLFTSAYPTISQAIAGPLDPFLGWNRLVQGQVKVHVVKSSHRNIHLPPYCNELARYLQEELFAADEKSALAAETPCGC